MAIATQVNSPTFKDIITVVIKWVAGLMGPIAIPFMLGLLAPFRKSGPTAALDQLGAGLLTFWLVNYPINWNIDGGVPLQYQVSVPLAVSLVLYIVIGFLKPEGSPGRDVLLAVSTGRVTGTVPDSTAESLRVPAQAKPGGDGRLPGDRKGTGTESGSGPV